MTALARHQYLIKERKEIMKNSNTFDIYDLETQEPLFECIPDNQMMPNYIQVTANEGSGFFTIVKESTFFEKVISLYDGTNQVMAHYKKKGFSLGNEYKLNHADSTALGSLKAEWDNRSFKLSLQGTLFAQIESEFSGLKKGIQNTVNDYTLNLLGAQPLRTEEVMYAIAAVFCIDMTMKAY